MIEYKTIIEQQQGKCSCGNNISGQPIFIYKDGIPIKAICYACLLSMLKDKQEQYDIDKEVKRKEERRKSRLNWLNPDHHDYETRLRCHKDGHRVIQGQQGMVDGGCWCGYYSPDEKPYPDLDY